MNEFELIISFECTSCKISNNSVALRHYVNSVLEHSFGVFQCAFCYPGVMHVLKDDCATAIL